MMMIENCEYIVMVVVENCFEDFIFGYKMKKMMIVFMIFLVVIVVVFVDCFVIM